MVSVKILRMGQSSHDRAERAATAQNDDAAHAEYSEYSDRLRVRLRRRTHLCQDAVALASRYKGSPHVISRTGNGNHRFVQEEFRRCARKRREARHQNSEE